MENNNKEKNMNMIEKLRSAAEQGDAIDQRELRWHLDVGLAAEQD